MRVGHYADMIASTSTSAAAPTTTTTLHHRTQRQQGCTTRGAVFGGGGGGYLRPGPSMLQTMVVMMMMMMRRVVVAVVVVLLCARPCAAATKTEYFMDDYSACNLRGYIDIPSGMTISIQLKRPGGTTQSAPPICALRFRAEQSKELLQIQYKEFNIESCSVSFKVNRQWYRCKAAKPLDAKLSTREVDLVLTRPTGTGTENYGGHLFLATYKSADPGPRDDAVSNPSLIGIIVGSVCGVILVILLLAIIGICCYQRSNYQGRRGGGGGGHADPVLHHNHDDAYDMAADDDKCCYINELEKKNGSPVGGGVVVGVGGGGGTSPSLHFADIVKEYTDRNKGGGGGGGWEKDGGGGGPRSPVVDALHGNVKFRASYQSTEEEAEERARRVSQGNDGGGGDTPPTPPPPLMMPVVVRSPAPPSSSRVQQHADPSLAGIRRVPARSSATSDDLDLLEKELLGEGGAGGDPRIVVLQPDVVGVTTATAEVVPIKIQPRAFVEPEGLDHTDLTTDDSPFSRGANYGSSSTHHSLQPARHRSPASKAKQQQHQQQQQPAATRNKDAGLSSLRKRGPKSPRLNTKGRRLMSEAEDESVYGDEQPQRSETPLSVMGVRSSRADDLESLPPLRRSASKQSLFASRTSLYSRRGKKERRPSIADSLDSYAQDDLNLCSSGVQSQPVSKQHARAFKSLGSIIAPPSPSISVPPAAGTSTTDAAVSSMGRPPKKSTASLSSQRQQHHGRQTPRKSTSSHKSSMSTQTIDQKGTQTEGGGATTEAPPPNPQLRPVLPAKPLLKPTVKPLPSRDIGGGGGGGALPLSAKLPPASLKSHFQPIAYNNNNNNNTATSTTPVPRAAPHPAAATTTAVPGGYALPPPPPPPPTDPSRPAKSPWELLCELTNTDAHTSPASEAGVSTLGGHPRTGAAPPHFAVPYPVAAARTATATPPPSVRSAVSSPRGGPFIPPPSSFTTALPPPYPNVVTTLAAPTRYTPSSVGSESMMSATSSSSLSHPPPTNVGRPALDDSPYTTRKSSWDALKELADNQVPYTPPTPTPTPHRGNTESIV